MMEQVIGQTAGSNFAMDKDACSAADEVEKKVMSILGWSRLNCLPGSCRGGIFKGRIPSRKHEVSRSHGIAYMSHAGSRRVRWLSRTIFLGY